MAEKILVRIKDPRNYKSSRGSKRSQLTEVYCQNPFDCDIYLSEKSCLMCNQFNYCKFAHSVKTVGPTPAARSFYLTMQKWKDENKDYLDAVKSAPPNRIFRSNGYYYLPYSFIQSDIGWKRGSHWISESDVTSEFLADICTPRYQLLSNSKEFKEFVKFIADLDMFYPELFSLLPKPAKELLSQVSYVGRNADLVTCAPGKYVFNQYTWDWDGTLLHGKNLLFPPVKGEISISIKPEVGQSVTITDNAQVTADTKFLD